MVLVDNLGSIMNVYVNFCLPVNTSGNVMQIVIWEYNRDRWVNNFIKNLLNFGVDIISCFWVIEIHIHQ